MICGSMFSGKTEELIRRLRRAQFANLRVEIFKPCVDTRYSDEEVVSHDAHAIRSTPVESAQRTTDPGADGGRGPSAPGSCEPSPTRWKR